MDIKLSPGMLKGTVVVPPSKSYMHRLIILRGLSGKPVAHDELEDFYGHKSTRREEAFDMGSLVPDDVRSTAEAVGGLFCADFGTTKYGSLRSTENDDFSKPRDCAVSCGESGSTLRFLLPLCCALGRRADFFGAGRLMSRPMQPLTDALRQRGMDINYHNLNNGRAGISITGGRLLPGEYTLAGDTSSQFISGLLMALPLLDGQSTLTVTGRTVSAGYIDMTLHAMAAFGVNVKPTKVFGTQPDRSRMCGQASMPVNKSHEGAGFEFAKTAEADSAKISMAGSEPVEVFHISGPQRYTSPDKTATPEGDWSAGAFWVAANALGSDITIDGLRDSGLQGDCSILYLCKVLMAGKRLPFPETNPYVNILQFQKDGSCHIDGSNIPDIIPILAVVAAWSPIYKTTFTNIERLKDKESDRIQSTTGLLAALGARAETDGGALLTVYSGRSSGNGSNSHCPANAGGATVIDCAGDHRIAMAGAIAALRCETPVILKSAEVIRKSYPEFFDDYLMLGGDAVEIRLW